MNRIKLNGTYLTIGGTVVSLSKADIETLRSFSTIDTFSSVTLETANHTVFMGAYIDRGETGFIFQVIDKTSRRIEAVRLPFGDTTLANIKEYIGSFFE